MKSSTILILSAIFCFFTAVTQSQTVNQKLITGIPSGNGTIDAYSLKYNAATGGWVYAAYDTTSSKYTIISSKGTSKPFSYAMQYNTLFDADGNSYMIASENITDTVYRYSVLKNNEPIAVFDFILEGWVMKDNTIYYAAQESGKYYLVTYETKSGVINKSKAYDEIRLAYTPNGYSEGEPVGYIGFTKAGQVYYVASLAGETFLVIGDTEQKHYSDISWYDLKFNAQDEPCYIAKSQGKFYDVRGNTFVVKGTQEFKTFDWVYGPLEFDNSGSPMYTGQDSAGEYIYRSTLMNGGTAIATVTGSIYSYMYTPSGKLSYVVSESSTSANGESVNKSYLVVDGKKSETYTSVNLPVFGNGSKVLYTASDKNNKYFVVEDKDIISDKYDYISEARFIDGGKIAYVGVKYGNYEKKIADKSYVVIGDETYGPYNTVNTADWKTNVMVLTDGTGSYAYMAGEVVDMTNYVYKYTVYSNKGESKSFDNISELKYVNNKLCYFAGNEKRKSSYIYDYTLYVNNKKVGDTYSAYSDVNVTPDGVMTFIASKGNDLYYVEVKP
ncbi:MAG: hypothetical protein ABI543_05270 [Ignavibacteria bacterium]